MHQEQIRILEEVTGISRYDYLDERVVDSMSIHDFDEMLPASDLMEFLSLHGDRHVRFEFFEFDDLEQMLKISVVEEELLEDEPYLKLLTETLTFFMFHGFKIQDTLMKPIFAPIFNEVVEFIGLTNALKAKILDSDRLASQQELVAFKKKSNEMGELLGSILTNTNVNRIV